MKTLHLERSNRLSSRRRAESGIRDNVIRFCALLLLSISLGGCFMMTTMGVAEGYVSDGIDVINPRFQLSPSLSVRRPPGGDFWLKQGDSVYAVWDEFSFYISRFPTECDRAQAHPPECRRCDVISLLNDNYCTDYSVSPPHTILPPQGMPYLDIRNHPGLGAPITYTSETLFLADVRLQRKEQKPLLTSTLEMFTELGEKGRLASAKVHVITDASPAIYEIERIGPQGESNPIFYGKKVPDDFSPNLRAGKIRVLKGTTENIKMGLGDPVKPSRVFFISGFDGYRTNLPTGQCYARYPNESQYEDGAIDLTSCRQCVSCSAINNPANPSFWNDGDGDPDDSGRLTWFVEFNPAHGGVLPTLENGEVLALEFTIAPRPTQTPTPMP